MYRIDFDPGARVLRMQTEGFWTRATMACFAAEALAKGAAARVRHGAFAVFNDARRFPVQELDVATAIGTLMQQGTKLYSGPTVVVASSMLGKMQGDRVMKGDKVRIFIDLDEANAWMDANWIVPAIAA